MKEANGHPIIYEMRVFLHKFSLLTENTLTSRLFRSCPLLYRRSIRTFLCGQHQNVNPVSPARWVPEYSFNTLIGCRVPFHIRYSHAAKIQCEREGRRPT